MPKTKRKTKTTFRVDPGVLSKFQRFIEPLGLRRDKYVNMILPEAITWLRRAQKNSPTAERFWKSFRDVRGGSHQKVAVLLDATVLADMNAACAEKHIPRDQFFETLLESLFTQPANGNGPAPLPRALDLIEDPWQDWEDGSGQTPFDKIIMSDFTEDDLLEVLKDTGLPKV
jgi:hypothetical protein